MAKRKYTIRKFYTVTCDPCNEDIAEDYPRTLAEAKEQRDVHEAWHVTSDAVDDATPARSTP